MRVRVFAVKSERGEKIGRERKKGVDRGRGGERGKIPLSFRLTATHLRNVPETWLYHDCILGTYLDIDCWVYYFQLI